MVEFPRVIGHEISATVLGGTAEVPAGSRVVVVPYSSCGHCAACHAGRNNACRWNETMGVQRSGGLTERIAVPASKVIASSLSRVNLALVEPLTVGFHAASRGSITAQDTVAIFGCGGIGLGAVSGTAYTGARTIAIDVNENKLTTAAAAGATHCINAAKEDVRARLNELTDGDGPSVVLEAIGSPDTFRLAVEVVAFTGRVVYVGYAKEPVDYETKLFVQKELDIRGSRNALPADFRTVLSMLESGKFPAEEAISAIVSIEEAPGMLQKWSSDPAAFTKILVDVCL